jgi:hypothetical protein
MRRLATVGVVLLAIAGVFLMVAGPGVAQPTGGKDEWLLYPAQDEASVERKVAAYLKATEGLEGKIETFEADTSDVYVLYKLTPGNAPGILVTVDTLVAGKDKDKVTERTIELAAVYTLADEAKTPAVRQKILELNNSWHQENWTPGRIYLDTDGDLVLETYVNIPGQNTPIHAELVRDALLRIKSAWNEYYPRLAPIIKTPAKQPTPAPS